MPETSPQQVRVPRPEYWDTRHPWQIEATKALDVDHKRFIMAKCHRGARKSTWAINTLIRECCRHPMRSYAYVGPTRVQARDIAWTEPTMLFHWLPDQEDIAWEQNKDELNIIFPNKSRLGIRGSDYPGSIRGLNPYGVVIDEFSECKPDLWPEVIQPIMRRSTDRWCAMIYTPRGIATYAFDLWQKTKDDPEWAHFIIRASESGIIPKAELDAARRTTPYAIFMQEYNCDDVADEEYALITSAMVESLRGIELVWPSTKRVISVDPAASTHGDLVATYYTENFKIVEEEHYNERDTMKIAGKALLLGKRRQCNTYVVDTIGVGKGVSDRILELGGDVLEFNGSAKLPDDPTLANRRIQAYWRLMQRMQDHEIPYPEDILLRQDLCSVRLRPIPSGGKVILEAKEITKKRLGRSPDRGDSYAMNVWAYDYIDADEEEKQDYGRSRDRRRSGSTPPNAMTC